ncbi:MAG: M23 family metallopeptidase [Leptospiraceae bacterium]|nr:M23 family metallopeptidase [Leptospiraceae bacterium]MCP5493398.1 M23 family metallopeptidase [Leptospiraceae bacterium]
MLIPHTEKKSRSIYISYRAISIFILILALILSISAINVLNQSGNAHEINEFHYTNKDYIRQSAKLRSEAKTLHNMVQYYYEKISSLYLKLGGDPFKLSQPSNQSEQLSVIPQGIQTNINSETYTIKGDIYNLKLVSELTNEVIKLMKNKSNIIENTPSLWPTKGYILFPYGNYLSPITGKEETNNGIDIGTFPGTEVIATAPGTVLEIGYTEVTGNFIKIKHKYSWKTIYSNLDRIQVEKGKEVSRGDIIGYVGKSSLSSIFYLHYEVHVGTKPLNPYSFLNQIQN